MSTRTAPGRRAAERPASRAQIIAGLAGVTFLLVGVLGFIPGITTDFDDMTFAGHDSGAELFGIFHVSVLHNLVHLLFGVLGLIAARTWHWARTFLVASGLVYLVLWVYGLVIDLDSDANFVPVDDADNWLHFGLGVVLLTAGVLTGRSDERSGRTERTAP